MKRVILICILFSTLTASSQVDLTTARIVAVNFLKSKKNILQDDDIVRNITHNYKEHPSYYVFVLKEKGFAIISANRSVEPILAYSLESRYDENDLPEAYNFWMKRYDILIDSVSAYKIRDKSMENKWNEILSGKIKKANDKSTYPNFFLTTLWGQTEANDNACVDAYNYFVSHTSDACMGGCNFDNKCSTGCVATAMGLVMNYWKFADGASYIGINDAFFDWWNMKDAILYYNSDYEKDRNTIAHLLERCGNILGMSYCSVDCASASGNQQIENHMPTYNYSATHKQYLFYTLKQWQTMIRNDIDNGQPVILGGIESIGSGHAWVCDGYNDGAAFHYNWGQYGSLNGWYTITGQPYNKFIDGVFNIHPNPDADAQIQNIILGGTGQIVIDLTTGIATIPTNNYVTQVQNSITVAGSGTVFQMPNNTKARFLAGNSIRLKQGFRASSGSTFMAKRFLYNEAKKKESNYSDLTETNEVLSNENSHVVVYPNPTHDDLYLQCNFENDQTNIHAAIYDIFGNIVYNTEKKVNYGETIKINTHSFSAGVFFVKIISGNFVETQKILIQ